MKKDLVLIDHSSLVYRSFYAVWTQTKGEDIVPALHLYEAWLKQIKKNHQAAKFIAALDLNNRQASNFELLNNYKEGRHTPDNLKNNFAKFEDIVSKNLIIPYGINGNEADDVIASLVNNANNFEEISIVSNDKDLLQLVNDNANISVTSFINGGGSQQWKDEDVIKKFDIEIPSQVVDFKALAGDGSDGYTGVKGVGQGKASKLIHQYHNLENILEHAKNGEVKGVLGKNLVQYENDARICYKLAKLNSNLQINHELLA